ncbi:hypothetical protein [Mesorhizobium sp. AA22]|uniref:hypothetical protein n=1 Tax=Mesorhizobium sp. AA22 TaxID=1854057 RepID=UPI0007ECFDAE|nr:hypothetical protein [Mesorhizobium sp. AA22]QIA24997.1 hypothetical protein A9K68_026700 [Mesorhizobium sp. AA22]
MKRPWLTLNRLTFTGPNGEAATLDFSPGLYVLYGASNTGKSFSVKSLDFLLGAARELPGIAERAPYDRGWLGLELPISGLSTFMRALAGGSLEYHPDLVTSSPTNGANMIRALSGRHDSANTDNVSQFLLNEIGLTGREIATDANGKKRPLSFRDLSKFCIVDETSIQSETSPALSGQYTSVTAERSVFKLMLTGDDDSAIVPVVDRKTFKASTTGKFEVLDDMISALDEKLTADFPNADQLVDQNASLEQTYHNARREFDQAQESIRARLAAKRNYADAISRLEARRAEIHINIGRFEQLQEVYQSDVLRLESIEEAGFLLGLGGDRDCPLCGAIPENQKHARSLDEIEKTRAAAGAEIAKIKHQSVELETALADLHAEGLQREKELIEAYDGLAHVERGLAELAPTANEARRRLHEALSVRDKVREGLALIEQRASLLDRRTALAALRPAAKNERPNLSLPTNVAYDFAQMVSSVLEEWQFPGQRNVSFDETSFDLIIDGKHRRDNGKGVRAITHAAFKVALFLFCRERQLPHPGFVLLDTPLLTYRDPIHSKAGPLTPDEAALSNTSLKDFFFEHLSKNGDTCQFLVIENVELPSNIESLGKVETLTGNPATGRAGLFLPARG